MEIIGKEEFDNAENLPIPKNPYNLDTKLEMSASTFKSLLKKMNNPLEVQKEIAVRIQHFLERKIDQELKKDGYLGDSTLRWVDQFNKILTNLQKGLHGDKSVHLHQHIVSHSQIAAKIRQYKPSIKVVEANVDTNSKTQDSND